MFRRKLTTHLLDERHFGGRQITKLVLHDIVTPAAPQSAPFEVARSAPIFLWPVRLKRLLQAALTQSSIWRPSCPQKGISTRDIVSISMAPALCSTPSSSLPMNIAPCRFNVVQCGFEAPFPGAIGDQFFLTLHTSCGAQEAIGELLLADYTQRSFFAGVGIRPPLICVRLGKPNKVASSFFSCIIRDPLSEQEAVLSVSEDVRQSHASSRSAAHPTRPSCGLWRDRPRF